MSKNNTVNSRVYLDDDEYEAFLEAVGESGKQSTVLYYAVVEYLENHQYLDRWSEE